MTEINRNIVDDQVNMRVLPIEDGNLTALVFDSMKVMVATAVIREGLRSGAIGPATTVVETTSGTMGFGLAVVCRQYGLRLILVGDSAISSDFKARLEELGAEVIIVDEVDGGADTQRRRLEEVKRVLTEESGWAANQYHNSVCRHAYAPAAEAVSREFGVVDYLVVPTGSGGASGGLALPLRALYPDLRLIGVDTFSSSLFGLPAGPRMLRGIGNSITPSNLLHEQFDEVHWLSAKTAFLATRQLHSLTTLKRGPTSGAAYHVARWYAARKPGKRVLAVFPDDGTRYLDTVYNDNFLQAQNFIIDDIQRDPHRAEHPSEAASDWSMMAWNRRTLQSVLTEQHTMTSEATRI